MRSVTYSMNVSLDGYIAGPDGGFDWTTPGEIVLGAILVGAGWLWLKYAERYLNWVSRKIPLSSSEGREADKFVRSAGGGLLMAMGLVSIVATIARM
ncbi:hypothetical protein [Thermomonospora cellulosilytica]|uniref:Uncharacterized protein n=1 Tax=Thermomonospora cellulosilytica TaxID=1411118 RepID=A0A7W3MVU8_9ACTN|nr:hypothetical protein [Thermomonospora cellulosilytica]MBA9002831.1 hypothetical protein [Thermomonospora cellulosilytica]